MKKKKYPRGLGLKSKQEFDNLVDRISKRVMRDLRKIGK